MACVYPKLEVKFRIAWEEAGILLLSPAKTLGE